MTVKFTVVSGPSIEEIERAMANASDSPENPEALRFVIPGGIAIELPTASDSGLVISVSGGAWDICRPEGETRVWIHGYDPATGTATGMIR